jgi:hypothetical protein
VAVGAADLTFGDLSLDSFPAPAAIRVVSNVIDFVADVIELEDDDVGLAAIDARVGR